MASINKLSVRGLRSFSPEDEDQVVEFYFPITVLVGQNGCGKTTIIEALRYAITGGFPPGGSGKAGQSFVHDPRNIGQPTVKASVKLRFTSRKNQTMVVLRSMELTQKKTNAAISFKQLDGVLRMLDQSTGQKISMSHKCSELDNQIPALLGISKAILDNVLFCHQEDASWPLMESAVVKKRFDDIFDSSRYTKAIDVFRKQEKDLINRYKELKADIAGLASHKHAVDGFLKELREQQETEEELSDEKKRITEEVAKLEKEVAAYEEILEQVDTVRNDVTLQTRQLESARASLKKLKEMVEEDLTATHTEQELKIKLRDFDEKTSTQKEQEADLTHKVLQIQKKIDSLHNKEMDLKAQMGQFLAKKEAHEKRVKARFVQMEKIANDFSVDLRFSLTQNTNASFISVASQSLGSQDTIGEISADDMKSFFQTLKTKQEDLKARLQQHRKDTQENEDRLQQDLMTLGGNKKAIENERDQVKNQKDEIQNKLDEIPKQDGRQKLQKSMVEEAKQRAKLYAENRDKAENDERKTEIPLQLRNLNAKVDEIRRKIDEERLVLDSLRDSADAQNAIAVLQEECERDFRSLEEAFKDEASEFQKFNLQPPQTFPSDDDESGDALVKAVESTMESVSGKYESLVLQRDKESNEASKTQRNISEKTALLGDLQRRLGTSKAKMERLGSENGCVSKVRRVAQLVQKTAKTNVPTERSPTELLVYLDKQLEVLDQESPLVIPPDVERRLQKRIGLAFFITPTGNEGGDVQLTENGSHKIQCPCCKRDFKKTGDAKMEPNDVKAMVKQLLSDCLTTNAADSKRYEDEKKHLLECRKVVYDNLSGLRDYWRICDEVQDLEKEIQQLDTDTTKLQKSLKEQNDVVSDLQRETRGLRQLLDFTKRQSEDATRISTKKFSISQKIMDLSINTPNYDRDLRTVEREMAQKMDEKDSLTNKVNELNKEMTKLNATCSDLGTQATRADARAKELEANYAAQSRAEELRKELSGQLGKLNEKYVELGEQLAPLQQKIKTKETAKQRLRAEAGDEEQKLAASSISFDSDVQRLRELTKQIDFYAKSEESGLLDRVENQLSATAERIGEHKKELNSMQSELERVRNLVKDQERSKNQLQHNIEIIKEEASISNLEKQIHSTEEAINAIPGADTADGLQKSAEGKLDKLKQKKAQTEGRYAEIVERIRSLKRKLAAPEYNNIEVQYKTAVIKAETTHIAAEDLRKYQKALDQALLQYHSVKIAEVNKIIRELWLLTYKGEDINNIQIQSGQEAGSRAQKSYNYRVVMTKGSSELDMRGRCSAGQRVLASIVIRLALAETFGVNCGCIALDEPTVNVDEKNKKGLAVALAQIVASRAQQRNFQLILITHDEDFVSTMKTELSAQTGFSMPEKYFEVCREQASDGKYYSKIHAKDWDGF